WERGVYVHPPSQPRSDVRNQRRGGGRGYSKIVPMEEFSLHLMGDMHAAAIDARVFHEDDAGTTRRFFDRLSPVTKDGSRRIAPVMLRRLRKLGIAKTDSNDLTPGRTQPFCAAGHPPGQHKWRRVLDTNDRMSARSRSGKARRRRKSRAS